MFFVSKSNHLDFYHGRALEGADAGIFADMHGKRKQNTQEKLPTMDNIFRQQSYKKFELALVSFLSYVSILKSVIRLVYIQQRKGRLKQLYLRGIDTLVLYILCHFYKHQIVGKFRHVLLCIKSLSERGLL